MKGSSFEYRSISFSNNSMAFVEISFTNSAKVLAEFSSSTQADGLNLPHRPWALCSLFGSLTNVFEILCVLTNNVSMLTISEIIHDACGPTPPDTERYQNLRANTSQVRCGLNLRQI